MESRKSQKQKPNHLPADYLKMVCEVTTAAFAEFLGEQKKGGRELHFECNGAIFPEEILLSLSICEKSKLGATTIHVSADFDPKASVPKADDLLGLCVDAAGEILQGILQNPKNQECLMDASLAGFEDVPFEWTPVEIEKKRLFARVDRSNPRLDQMADDWLSKNDPKLISEEAEAQEEAKSLFITGKPGSTRTH